MATKKNTASAEEEMKNVESAIQPEEIEEYDEDVFIASTGNDEGSKELIIPSEDDDSQEDSQETSESDKNNTGKDGATNEAAKAPRRKRVETVNNARAKRKLYNEGFLFDEDEGKIQLNAKNSERHKEFLDLVASAKSANVKKGTIVGVDTTESDRQICAVINYGNHFEVKIPVEQLVDFSLQPPENQKAIAAGGESRERCLRKIASAMEGAEVSYRVYALSESSAIAFADHLEAMSRKGRLHYATPRRDGKPDVVEGMKVNAKVMAVNMIGMWIEAAGAQAFIRAEEISWNRSSDITKEYSPGDTVMVYIMGIHSKSITYKIQNKEKTVNVVEVDASVKRCLPNPNQIYYDKYEIGSRGLAEVVQITESGIFVVYRDKVSVLLAFPETGENPNIGDQVSIKIDKKVCIPENDEYLFYGNLIRVMRRAEN